MPPSGFIKMETDALSTFTKNILTRFNQEVEDGKFSSVTEGIKYELKIIEKYLLLNISDVERGVLELVKQLYLSLQKGESISNIVNNLNDLQYKNYD